MPRSIVAHHSLTGAQAGIWYAQQLEPENPIYNTAEYVEINGSLQLEHFEKALRQAIEEADSLHTRFGESEDGPWQEVREQRDFSFHFIDVSGEKNPRQAAESWMKVDLAEAIDRRKICCLSKPYLR